ncbi:MAG: ATP-binding cassette domain-containing protein, partial [Cyanobacteria bacterium J06648_11]
LARVEALDLRDRPIGKLSGGQQQRVFLARALVQQADAYFFDEPFVGIDKKTEAVIFDIFHELAAAGKTVVVVHHDLGETMTHFDSLILLNRELIASGARELVLTANNLDRAYSGKVAFYNRGAA